MSADAAIVHVATWTAGLAGSYLTIRAAVAAARTRPGALKTGTLLGLMAAIAGGGVALAAPGARGPHRPHISVDWPHPAARPHTHPVVVTSGDSLWTISARRLHPPTAARVAAAWPQWWHANQRVVGRNPNLIHPGQRLRPPNTVRSRS